MGRQLAAAGLTVVARSGVIVCISGCWGEHLRRSARPGDERGCTVSCERRRLPRDALLKLDVLLRLAEEVPV